MHKSKYKMKICIYNTNFNSILGLLKPPVAKENHFYVRVKKTGAQTVLIDNTIEHNFVHDTTCSITHDAPDNH